MTELVPVVVYGVKSSPDEKESVADHHQQLLAAIERESGRRVVGEPFGEANASGYRGSELEAAVRAAIAAARRKPERHALGDGRVAPVRISPGKGTR